MNFVPVAPLSIARHYGLSAHRYDREGSGVLVAVGCGLMLAVMDQIDDLRWCVDVSGLRDKQALERWLSFMSMFAKYIVVAAWYSVSKPTVMEYALQRARLPVFVYSNAKLPGTRSETLLDLERDVLSFLQDVKPTED